MRRLDRQEFEEFLTVHGISVADPKLSIGRELHYQIDPPRVVVVHFAKEESPEYISGVLSRILDLDKTWIIVPRYGTVTHMNFPGNAEDAAALLSDQRDFEQIISYLVGLWPVHPGGADPYLLGGSGGILVPYDHHIDQGMGIHLSDVALSEQLLISLNRFGAELELYYIDHE